MKDHDLSTEELISAAAAAKAASILLREQAARIAELEELVDELKYLLEEIWASPWLPMVFRDSIRDRVTEALKQ